MSILNKIKNIFKRKQKKQHDVSEYSPISFYGYNDSNHVFHNDINDTPDPFGNDSFSGFGGGSFGGGGASDSWSDSGSYDSSSFDSGSCD